MFTGSDFTALFEGASTLRERLDGPFTPAGGEDAGRRLRRMRELAAGGDERLFERRLAWDGLREEDVARVIDRVRVVRDFRAPPWLERWKEAGPWLSKELGRPRFFDEADAVPFEEVFGGLVLYAGEKLRESSRDPYRLFGERAHALLERSLLQLLSRVYGSTLQKRFDWFRSRSGSLRALFGSSGGNRESRELYLGFLERLREGALREILLEHPVLARLLSELTGSWISVHGELLQRLHSDRGLLASEFGIDAGEGSVASLQPYASDLHEGGRAVVRLDFARGESLVYKPRDLSLEKRFFELLRWLDERSPAPRFRSLRVLDRSGYGWVECARAGPRPDARGAGALLAVLYLLDGMDAHLENLVFTENGAVLVDAETLFHPRLAPEASSVLSPGRASLLADRTVRRTELLPGDPGTAGGKAFAYAGIFSRRPVPTPFRKEGFREVNTDGMRIESEPFTLNPRGFAEPSDPDFADDLACGFEAAYRLLMAKRGLLLAPGGPLQSFSGLRGRVVLRPSGVYGALFRRILSPEVLRSGALWSIEAEALVKPFLRGEEKPLLWPMLAEERASIDRLDTPRFEARSDETVLRGLSGRALADALVEPSHRAVVRRAEALSEDDLDFQLVLIRAALSPPARDRRVR